MNGENRKHLINPNAMKDVWRVNEWDFMRMLEKQHVPQYKLNIIRTIKSVGQAVLGDEIISLGEHGGVGKEGQSVTIDDILRDYPSLLKASKGGSLTLADISEGITKFRYLDDNIGFVNATYLLPDKVTVRGEEIIISHEERKPILAATTTNIDKKRDKSEDVAKIKNNPEIWSGIADYLKFFRKNPLNYDQFMVLAKENGKVVVPLNFARSKLSFIVKDPFIEIIPKVPLWGQFDIQAVALFEKDIKRNQSRIIIKYFVGTKWTQSLPVISKMVEELRGNIEKGFEAGTSLLKKSVMSAGGMSGK